VQEKPARPAAPRPVPGESRYLRRIVDSTPSLMAYWGADLRCRFANQAYARWFGVDPDALVGTSIQDLLGPELFALNQPHLASALEGKEQLFERVVPGKDGVQRHSLARYIPDIVNGVVEGIVVEVTETTLLKQTEASLRASERRFRALAESSPFGIYETDAQGVRIYTNARWQQIYGFGGVRGTGDDWVDALHPDDRDAVLAARDRSVARGEPFDMEFRIRRPDGQWRIVHSRGRPLFSESGAPAGFVGAVLDETERRLSEARLRSSESLLDRTGRLAGVGGWEVDLRTNEITWSEHTRRIHGVAPGFQLTLDGAIDFYAPQARPVIRAAVSDAIANGTPWDLELPFVAANGRELWVRSLGEVEFEAGRPVRLIGAFKDITELRQQQQRLRLEQEARAQSERHAHELDRLLAERGEMLDVMAHEVRQPLNNASAALQSAAEVLGESGATAASSRLSRAQNVMGAVLSSIDNTLAVASLLARSGPIHRVDTDVGVLLQLAIADLPAQERDRIAIERAPGTWTASMDLSLMRLAVRNVLSNALKYSPPRSIVTVRLSDSDEPLALLIDVADAGQGIPQDVVPRLFQRGPHRNRERAPTGHGLGLGLYIVRRVMELHGGGAELSRNAADGATIRLIVTQPADD
jgi:PAS domain S-box-containing protein